MDYLQTGRKKRRQKSIGLASKFRTQRLDSLQRRAIAYLKDRQVARQFTPIMATSAYLLAAVLPKRDAGPLAKLAAIKLWCSMDKDAQFQCAAAGYSLHSMCPVTGNIGTLHPFGHGGPGIAMEEQPQNQPHWIPNTPSWLKELLNPYINIRWDYVRILNDSPKRGHGSCVLCGLGENSPEHWIYFCPFANGVLSLVLGHAGCPEQWYGLPHASNRSTRKKRETMVTAINVIHALRREIVARRGFKTFKAILQERIQENEMPINESIHMRRVATRAIMAFPLDMKSA